MPNIVFINMLIVIGSRWLEAESTIKQNPNISAAYSQEVIRTNPTHGQEVMK